MLLKKRKGWEISEKHVTPKNIWLERRNFIKSLNIMGATFLSKYFFGINRLNAKPVDGFPAWKNNKYVLNEKYTDKEIAYSYNNYYEFGSSKNIWRQSKKLKTDPWKIIINGLVESDIEIDVYDLIRKIGPMEERIYRFRCVEAWSMVLPWTGVPLKNFVKFANPKSSAKFIQMETFFDESIAPGQKQDWYPWPYIEGITIDEATNDLAFLATGLYGENLKNQNGAPIRLMLPWKYGFKNLKGIVKFTFTDIQPTGMWEKLSPKEYGFWANVNPNVSHPRWSQKMEKVVGQDLEQETLIYNGYERQVTNLYHKYSHLGASLFR